MDEYDFPSTGKSQMNHDACKSRYTVGMTKYVALIRGIGPGDPRMRNDKLRGVFEALGFADVQSVISSGNIVFTADNSDVEKLEAMIEAALPEMLGFTRSVIVRSEQQLRALVDANPFAGAPHNDGSYLLVTFFKHPTIVELALPYQPSGKPYKIVAYTGGALCSITDNTIIKTSDLMGWLEKQFGKEITSRTPLTVERILKRMAA